MIARRLVVGYFSLVGLPLLIVLLILKLGEGIQGPPSIDGSWVMEAQSHSPAPGECSPFLAGFAGHTLSVSQSGRFLAAAWDNQPGLKLRGMLEGNEFTLSSAGKLRGNCEQVPLRIDGRVFEARGKHALDARLSVADCGACGELRLVAVSRGAGSTVVLPKGF
jgi:hypothetical protein